MIFHCKKCGKRKRHSAGRVPDKQNYMCRDCKIKYKNTQKKGACPENWHYQRLLNKWAEMKKEKDLVK